MGHDIPLLLIFWRMIITKLRRSAMGNIKRKELVDEVYIFLPLYK